MATNRGKGRGQSQPVPGRRRVNQRSSEEVVHQYGDVESGIKQSNFAALQKAFNEISKKLRFTQDENMKLQTDKTALLQENEILKQKLGQGFKAFDDKFKETEQLRKELDLKEKQIADKLSESNSDQQCQTESTGSISCLEMIDTNTVQQETNSIQTEEEKTDEVTMFPPNFKDLLEYCGLEILFQDNKEYLVLTNRDNFIRWLENVTDGKVSVEFEKTHVVERFTQTDKAVTTTQHVQSCDHEAMIILFKSKITDQANTIKKHRQVLKQMEHIQSSAPMQKENKETSRTQNQALTRYHQTFLTHSREVENQVNMLKKQLESQQQYTRHLVDIIKGSKDLPKQIKLLSEVTHEKLKSQGQREVKKPPTFPVTEQHVEGDTEENPNEEDPFVDDSKGLYSIAVQETDEYPVTGAGNESSASVVTLAESRSSMSTKSGLGFSVDASKKTAFVDKEDAKPISAVQTIADEQTGSTGPDNDDIEVINEEDVAVGGGASGVFVGSKQCPVCYISFTPSSSQDEFESHVLAHFQD